MADLFEQFLNMANFQAAWQKVAANDGCAGVDGITVEKFGHRAETYIVDLIKAVESDAYRPLPLKQFFIPKNKDNWRSLAVPTVRDRIVQQSLLNVLHPILDPQFESCSFAYRPRRSYKMAVQQVAYWRDQGYQWVLDADIVKYFNEVQHLRLLREVLERLPNAAVVDLIEQWLAAGVLTRSGLVFPDKGLAQGSVISPILANVYLDDFDEAISQSTLKLVRYSDDFLVLAKSEPQIHTAQEQVANLLTDIGLQLHKGKTQITHFDRGFRFLGHVFTGTLIVPSQPHKPQPAAKNLLPEQMQAALPRLAYTDARQGQSTQMQQALFAAIQSSHKPIPPPLYVVLGYTVRDEKTITIESKEKVWNPGMSTLYLVQQQATLRRQKGRFLIQAAHEPQLEIPIHEVKRVLVFGNVQLTTSAMSVCLNRQIPVVFLSQSGIYKGHLWTAEQCDLEHQAKQFQRRDEDAFQMEMAMHVVWGKLKNSRQLLLRLNRKKRLTAVQTAIDQLAELITSVETAIDLGQLRGYEGAGASCYFSAFGHLLTHPDFRFTQRNRRPPKDPVNSLLSFGYTLLFNNVLSLILAEGLNPYLGNLHRSDRKEPHLAFDLMEEFRSPIVDSLVLMLINKKMLKPTDFTWPDDQGGIYLQNQARRVFLRYFEDRMAAEVIPAAGKSPLSYRRVIQRQIEQYKYCLQEGAAYEPFLRAT